MAKTIFSFILSSTQRISVVKTLLRSPDRQWSCTFLEQETKLPHATVFRTLQGLATYGILKSMKVNKRDLVYELVTASPWTKELAKILQFDLIASKEIASLLLKKLPLKHIKAIILYGSAVKNTMHPHSDIDILVVLHTHNVNIEQQVQSIAASVSSNVNRSISLTVMGQEELLQEKDQPYLKSVREHHEVVYGKATF